jgi:hypothetical protein
MWRLALGIVLSLLPSRWRDGFGLQQVIPWERATILSGILESLLAFGALVVWYSHSVTSWAAEALDFALRGGHTASYSGQELGLSAFVLWLLHPQTWLTGYFAFEGMVRMLAAISTEQIFGTLPLAFADWCFGKATGRPLQGDDLLVPGGKTQWQSFVSALKEKMLVRRLPQVEDQVLEAAAGSDEEFLLEVHSSRPKPEWIPPRIVKIADTYFRLEHVETRKSPRPFIFRLRRLAGGVPGRAVIVYEAPPSLR